MILLPVPLLGTLRIEPLRDLKRIWLWFTAPDTHKSQVWSFVKERPIEIRSFSDADLLISLKEIEARKVISWWPEGIAEAQRRGLNPRMPLPQWVQAVKTAAGSSTATAVLAEKLLRPEHAVSRSQTEKAAA